MKRLALTLVVLAGLTAAGSAAVLPRFAQGGDVAVTVTYTGKGVVSEKNEILVFLFDHPTPGPGSTPLATQAVTKSGGTATFKGVTTDPVYILFVYDEQANYDGNSPPPPGAPIGSYAKDGKPIAVKPGPTAKVKASFNDSVRWK